MATYLITGIAGFIGSSLARAVLAQGNVRGVDNFSTGKRNDIAELLDRIDVRQADLLDLEAMQLACRGVDYVLHEAAIPSVPRSVLNPLESNQANVDGTVNVLVAARDAKVKRVIYAASSSAYGDTPTLPKREDMSPNPISPYAVAKLASEYYMASFFAATDWRLSRCAISTSSDRGRIPRRRTRACWRNSLRRCSRESNRPSTAMALEPRFHLRGKRRPRKFAGLQSAGQRGVGKSIQRSDGHAN